MRFAVTASEMKEYDRNTIEEFGMLELVLMERAALAVTEEVVARFSAKHSILILVGCGNNGADGLAIGRLLSLKGYSVTFLAIGNFEKQTKSNKIQQGINEKYDYKLHSEIQNYEYDIIIDAIFGIGLSRNITSNVEKIMEEVNASRAIKIAVDMPSGIHTDTGSVMGTSICADITVTFAFLKQGMLLQPGKDRCGKIICKEIGITQHSFLSNPPTTFYFGDNHLPMLGARDHNGNKGTFGKVLNVSGSDKMGGAAILSTKSILSSGAGMVKVYTHMNNRDCLLSTVPEAMFCGYSKWDEQSKKELEDSINWCDVITLGPGLGISETAIEIVKYIVAVKKPLVIDADALNIMANNREILKLVDKRSEGCPVIMTPHLIEFCRLTDLSREILKENRLKALKDFAVQYNVVVALKDSVTLVSNKGKELFINTTGNDGMATAGSGDVLTGMIAGFLAQGMSAFCSTYCGVFFHGMAGDVARKQANSRSLIASDIIEALREVL